MRAAALWLLLVWLIGSSDHVRNAAHHPIGRRRLQTAVSRPGARLHLLVAPRASTWPDQAWRPARRRLYALGVSVAPYVKKGGEPKLAAPT